MATLDKDYTFDLDNYVFGYGTKLFTDEDGFDPGTYAWVTQDFKDPQGDRVMMGKDTREPRAWSWALHVNHDSPEAALAELEKAADVWANEVVRATPGAAIPLRYRIGGRTRRIYGRPGRFSYNLNNTFLSGHATVEADFRRADPLHYADIEVVRSVKITPSVDGGLTTPLVEPLSTVTAGAETEAQITVGGDAATWPVVKFIGPVARPYVEVAGWRAGLTSVLEAGETVTIDARPWARTAIRNDGAAVGGTLSRHTRMGDMKLPPGKHVIIFGGASSDPSARVEVRWRTATHSL